MTLLKGKILIKQMLVHLKKVVELSRTIPKAIQSDLIRQGYDHLFLPLTFGLSANRLH